MEDLKEYLESFVDPSIAELEQNPTSVRYAFVASVVIFHCVDYLAHPRRPASLRQNWRQQSKAFRTIDEVAHAFKHVISGNPRKPNLKAHEVVSKVGVFDATAFSPEFDVGSVTLENDPSVSVLTIAKEAVEFIRQQIK